MATKINGTEDFIQPGVTGEFVEHDPAHIASVVKTFLSAPQATLTTMGQAARRLIEESYTWARVTDLTHEAYGDYLLRGRGNRRDSLTLERDK